MTLAELERLVSEILTLALVNKPEDGEALERWTWVTTIAVVEVFKRRNLSVEQAREAAIKGLERRFRKHVVQELLSDATISAHRG